METGRSVAASPAPTRCPTRTMTPRLLGLAAVGEPDAGDRHVRFDERGWETERWPLAPSYRAHPRLYPFPRAGATALSSANWCTPTVRSVAVTAMGEFGHKGFSMTARSGASRAIHGSSTAPARRRRSRPAWPAWHWHGLRRLGAYTGELLRHRRPQGHARRCLTTTPEAFGGMLHVGPMARTVADTALVMSVMMGPHASDPFRS